jgi:hypothetical protein
MAAGAAARLFLMCAVLAAVWLSNFSCVCSAAAAAAAARLCQLGPAQPVRAQGEAAQADGTEPHLRTRCVGSIMCISDVKMQN